jgi:hypothetical protein
MFPNPHKFASRWRTRHRILASNERLDVRKSSAAADVSAEFCAIGAPFTVNEPPGTVSNAALKAGFVTESCAQANRARRISGSLPPITVGLSKRAPISLRTSVAFIAA